MTSNRRLRTARTPQTTLRDLTGIPFDEDLPGEGVRPATDPWGLNKEEETECRRKHRRLIHRVRIEAGGRVHIATVRDSSVATTDLLLRLDGAIELAPLPSREGIYTHKVHMAGATKFVWENHKTGEFTTSGRPAMGPFWWTWHPTPAILAVLRAKGLAQLVGRPVVPPKIAAKEPRGIIEEVQAAASRLLPVNSTGARRYHVARLEFLNQTGVGA